MNSPIHLDKSMERVALVARLAGGVMGHQRFRDGADRSWETSNSHQQSKVTVTRRCVCLWDRRIVLSSLRRTYHRRRIAGTSGTTGITWRTVTGTSHHSRTNMTKALSGYPRSVLSCTILQGCNRQRKKAGEGTRACA